MNEQLLQYIPQLITNQYRRLRDLVVWDEWQQRSWSQEGEDRILFRLFENKKHGFYVDVGAHHPKRFSNTYLFYLRGWNGLNIDATPGSMDLFNRLRPRDINIECGIGVENRVMKYLLFSEPALNGFEDFINGRGIEKLTKWKLEKTIDVAVRPLREVLLETLQSSHKIDFLNVDVEGSDFNVILSNDWTCFRPKVVLVEMLEKNGFDIGGDKVSRLMASNGYAPAFRSVNTVIFLDSSAVF